MAIDDDLDPREYNRQLREVLDQPADPMRALAIELANEHAQAQLDAEEAQEPPSLAETLHLQAEAYRQEYGESVGETAKRIAQEGADYGR